MAERAFGERERAGPWEVVATAAGSRPWEPLLQRARERLRVEWTDRAAESAGPAAAEPALALDVAEAERRVRLVAVGDGAGSAALLLHGVGFRWVTVRLYPDRSARERWSDFGRPGHALPPDVLVKRLGGLGRKPRVVAPVTAAGLLALSLERLGALGVTGAILLGGALALLCLALAASAKRGRIEWVAFARDTRPTG